MSSRNKETYTTVYVSFKAHAFSPTGLQTESIFEKKKKTLYTKVYEIDCN